eukprot:scaffold161098_cov20-Tisochrysis_lutea.AAC.1
MGDPMGAAILQGGGGIMNQANALSLPNMQLGMAGLLPSGVCVCARARLLVCMVSNFCATTGEGWMGFSVCVLRQVHNSGCEGLELEPERLLLSKALAP